MVWNSPDNITRKCRLVAVSAPHNGHRLHAVPVSTRGLKLDDAVIRVAVELRLGINLCIPHTCHFDLLVDATQSHRMCCKLTLARMSRHQKVNDII